MQKTASIRLAGDIRSGIHAVFRIDGQSFPSESDLSDSSIIEISANLAPAMDLADAAERWQAAFAQSRGLASGLVLRERDDSTKILCDKLAATFKEWTASPSFRPIRDAWNSNLLDEELILLIRTEDISILKLPWHLWDLLDLNPLAAMAFGPLTLKNSPRLELPKLKKEAKILCILGNDKGIDLNMDAKLISSVPDATPTFLIKPSRNEISEALWNGNWDILFFAGHSHSDGRHGVISNTFFENTTIEDLKYALRRSVGQGLQLAIFNSCDGIGLAMDLQELAIPHTIVMRERVPDLVAQHFLYYFLAELQKGTHLYLSVRYAAERLHGIGNILPNASWLPVIFQSGNAESPKLDAFGRMHDSQCPYQGLSSFTEQDTRFFFGRTRFVSLLVDDVNTYSLVNVIGASGTGKSSVVFAGLVPILRSTGKWHIVSLRPGSAPLEALIQSFQSDRYDVNTDQNPTPALIERFDQLPQEKVLIVVDQFEEIFTQCVNADDQHRFIDTLLSLAECPKVVVLTTLREDFLGRALAYAPLAAAMEQGTRSLGAMGPDDLLQAIEGPAKEFSVTVEAQLTERLIASVSVDATNLPLLEFVLEALWAEMPQNRLTISAYDRLGGIEQALTNHAEKAFSTLGYFQQKQAREVFLQLVSPGDNAQDVKRRATRKEIGESNWKVVQSLESYRLLVTSHEGHDDDPTVEPVHEALIRNWARLKNWVDEERGFRIWQEQLRKAIRQWEKSGKDSSYLLRGKQLAEAEDWLKDARYQPKLESERHFLSTSSRRHRKSTTYLISALVAAMVLVVIAGIGWWHANEAARTDRITALLLRAEKSYALSNSVFSGYAQEPEEDDKQYAKRRAFIDTAALNSVEAGVQAIKYPEVDTGLKIKVAATLLRIAKGKKISKSRILPECGEKDRGEASFSWSADKSTIACARYDGTVHLWDSVTGAKRATFNGDAQWVNGINISPDGKLLATGTAKGDVNLWNLADRTSIDTLHGDNRQIGHIVYSPDGKTLAAGTVGGTIILWNTQTKHAKTIRAVQDEQIHDESDAPNLEFSSDGKYLVSTTKKSIRLWETFGARLVKEFVPSKTGSSSEAELGSVGFLSDHGDTLLVHSEYDYHKTALHFWDISREQESKIINLPGRTFLSNDAKTAAVVDTAENTSGRFEFNTDTTKHQVSFWDLISGKNILTIKNLPGTPSDIAFNSDTSKYAIAVFGTDSHRLGPDQSEPYVISVWDSKGHLISEMKQTGEVAEVTGLHFSPDSSQILVGSAGTKDGWHHILGLWDVSSGRLIKELENKLFFAGGIGILADIQGVYTPDGKTIIATHAHGVLKGFDAISGAPLDFSNINTNNHGHAETVQGSTPDIKLTKYPDGSLLIENVTKKSTIELERWNDVLSSASHINDGEKTVTTVNWNGVVRKRDLASGELLKEGKLSIGRLVSRFAFSEDGRRVAAATDANEIKIFDADTGKEITSINNVKKDSDENYPYPWLKKSLRFSRDGSTIASLTWANDQTELSILEVWDLSQHPAKAISVTAECKDFTISADSRFLALLTKDNHIELWDLNTKTLVSTITPAKSYVSSIAFDKASNLLYVSGSGISIVDPLTNDELASLDVPISRLAFGAYDGQRLLFQDGNQIAEVDLDLHRLIGMNCNLIRERLRTDPNLGNKERQMCDDY